MAQTMSMPPKGFSKKPDRPGRYPRPLSLQTLAAKLGPTSVHQKPRGRRGHHRADRPGRGGQEPHHGRVRPAVDRLHRPTGHRADHLDQRAAAGAGRGDHGRRGVQAGGAGVAAVSSASAATAQVAGLW